MAQRQPNILFIMADQFRTATMTDPGDGIETLNIDRIRRMSVFFPLAACNSPSVPPAGLRWPPASCPTTAA